MLPERSEHASTSDHQRAYTAGGVISSAPAGNDGSVNNRQAAGKVAATPTTKRTRLALNEGAQAEDIIRTVVTIARFGDTATRRSSDEQQLIRQQPWRAIYRFHGCCQAQPSP
jgi:hypothetical protein